EAGSTFVTVHFGGWDHHWDLKKGYENYLPKVDRAVSTLFTDLDDRGLLDTTLVVLCGEFSRTPKMNDGGNGGPPMSMGTPGRDRRALRARAAPGAVADQRSHPRRTREARRARRSARPQAAAHRRERARRRGARSGGDSRRGTGP